MDEKVRRDAAPGAPGWTVEGALTQVIDAIARGALLMQVTETVRQRLRDLYRPDFDEQYKNSADWRRDEARVLGLAHVVGALAAERTVLKAVGSGHLPPIEVDGDEAAAAAYIVAQAKVCPPVKFLGAWCDKVPPGPGGRSAEDWAAEVEIVRAQLRRHGIA